MSTQWNRPACALLLALSVIGCQDDPTIPRAATPEFDFLNGPAVLANVFRMEGGQWGQIVDPLSGLLLNIGLPADPFDAIACGGTEPLDLHAYQLAGLARDALNLLAQADVNLHLYDASTYASRCSTVPMASGIGSLVINDNDPAVSGTRADAFGASVVGNLTFPSGETVRVTAHARFIIHLDGTFHVANSMVRLAEY